MAPHFFMEQSNIEAIRNTITAYETTGLRAKLARHHADVDAAFRGWSGAWLDPGFLKFDTTDALAYIRVPVLVVQGAADPYGTLAQVRVVEDECYCPVETVVMSGVGHAPHREKAEETLAAVSAFTDRIFRAHGEAFENAA
jgi:pimeloyl-ACP methyl ester carboxylesterase